MQDRWQPTKSLRKPVNLAVLQACIGAIASIFLVVPQVLVHGAELRCPELNVVVDSEDSADVDMVCHAAGEAMGFLVRNGLDTSKAVEVHLVKELPPEADTASYGCYIHPHRRVYLLTYSDCLERGPWASLPMDRELYKSLLAHEVAHAVAAANFSIPRPSMLAHEYLAYVTMFAVIAPEAREKILNRFPGHGFDSVDQMSVTYYLMDPLRFGAESYRHFLKLDDKKRFLQDVLSGRVAIGKAEQ